MSIIEYSVQDDFARITFNRIKAANAVDLVFALDFKKAVEKVRLNKQLRALLINANGPTFCVGGDLTQFSQTKKNIKEELGKIVDAMHDAIEAMYSLDIPIVASVQGPVSGIGLSVVCASDLVVSAETATFSPGYLAAGLTPDGGLTSALARLIGRRRAFDMIFNNRSISAAQAESWGLVNYVCLADHLQRLTTKQMLDFVNGPVNAFMSTKSLIRQGSAFSLKQQLDSEKDSILDSITSSEGQEGMAAFVEKRAPKFRDV